MRDFGSIEAVPRRAPPFAHGQLPRLPLATLREEIISLGPWHLDVQVTPVISTAVSREAGEGAYHKSFGPIQFANPSTFFRGLLKSIYPSGLEGRSVLDCACNCGGWLFWAKELGAGDCFGFDVRQHWIDQAQFLQRNRTEKSRDMRFEACDLYQLPQRKLKPFDITIFSGIFYHLPDPVTGLKIAADLTSEVLLLNTATRNGFPDGILTVNQESREDAMSGVHGLAWMPTGPEVMSAILRWAGFAETRCVFWRKRTDFQPPEFGRLQMIAARRAGILEHFDASGFMQCGTTMTPQGDIE